MSNSPIRLDNLAQSRGYAFGLSQRCLTASLELDAGTDLADLASRLTQAIQSYAPDGRAASSPLPTPDPAIALVEALSRWIGTLLEAAGIPPAGDGVILSNEALDKADGLTRLKIAIPALSPASTGRALGWIVEAANALSAAPGADELPSELRRSLNQRVANLREAFPDSNIRRHLLRAALALELPILPLPLGVVQLGWGSKARLFRGSASDVTPVIGAAIARNKLAAAGLLKLAGIPMPRHEPAPTPEAAVAAARELGFPVVVKPVDQDRGSGVTADLRTEDEVRRAYADARARSEMVMVEQHVEGREYRLLVVRGRLFWALERVPAGVTGDGSSTIRQLIEAVNRTRRDGPSDGLSLVRIGVDDRLREMLEGQGRTLETVPAAGEAVRLERAPSVAGGGEVRSVFDRVHPDNAALAERAARLLRLDIAGVDFLSPDIARSWRHGEGRVTEVNSQPQISPLSRPDMFNALLGELVEGDGRIPVALVLGDGDGAIEAAVRNRLAKAGICAGLASDRQVSIGAKELAQGKVDPIQAASALILDPTVEAIVMFVDARAMLEGGLPFDRIDVLAIADGLAGSDELRSFLSLAKPYLRGKVLAMREDPAVGLIAASTDERSLQVSDTRSNLARSLVKIIDAQGRR